MTSLHQPKESLAARVLFPGRLKLREDKLIPATLARDKDESTLWSVPGVVATGSQSAGRSSFLAHNPVATAPGSDVTTLHDLPRSKTRRPCPLEVVASELPGHIDYFADEIETRNAFGLHCLR
jgi:hypothetical protein